ncbi:hypothetical protein MCHI_002626 [Candidatus Magnetoovum chiemensis]|nr:hypothetical protein MCHI_002626 [Candidatus Magnetoovum chiemensis]
MEIRLMKRTITFLSIFLISFIFLKDADCKPTTKWTEIDRLKVPANGMIVHSNAILKGGEEYLIEVRGTFRYDGHGKPKMADAQFFQDNSMSWIRKNLLAINGINMTAKDNDLKHHFYTYPITGRNSSINFRILDAFYDDNKGDLDVSILANQILADNAPPIIKKGPVVTKQWCNAEKNEINRNLRHALNSINSQIDYYENVLRNRRNARNPHDAHMPPVELKRLINKFHNDKIETQKIHDKQLLDLKHKCGSLLP